MSKIIYGIAMGEHDDYTIGPFFFSEKEAKKAVDREKKWRWGWYPYKTAHIKEQEVWKSLEEMDAFVEKEIERIKQEKVARGNK